MAVRPSTSPANRSPATLPWLRLLSTSALPTGSLRTRSSVSAKQFGALLASGIGGDHGDRRPANRPARARANRPSRVQMFALAAKAVLERGQVVRGDADDAIDADRLKHLGEIARDDGIARLGLPLLAGIAR